VTATPTLEAVAAPPPRRPPRRVVLGIAGAVVAVVAAVWIVAFSPVLGVRTVDVRGAHVLTAGQVRTAAHVKHGTPLLRLDTAAIERRVAALAVVKSVSVTTSYPGTVTISVVERTAVGFVHGTSGYTLVDASGAQYRTLSARPAHLPEFVLPAGGAARAAAGALATVAAALPASVLTHIASIQALDPDAITLLLTDSRVVRWGSVDRSAAKAQLLPALLRQPGTQIDLTDPDQVVIR
jgi:cell division protein FtsQ